MAFDPNIAALVLDRVYIVDYTDRQGNSKTTHGKLISTDQDGFVVLEKPNGKKELIPKDRIDTMTESE